MTITLSYHDINDLSSDDLDRIDSFRYEGYEGNFTARKETRKTTDNAYWTAYKRKFGRLRKHYIGDSVQLFGDNLEDVAKKLNASDTEFWRNRPGGVAEKERRSQPCPPQVTQNDTQRLDRIGELTEQLNAAKKEIYELTKALIEVKERNFYIERNFQELRARTNPEAITILEQALSLKPNAGGAIKTAIREALELMKLPNNSTNELPNNSVESKPKNQPPLKAGTVVRFSTTGVAPGNRGQLGTIVEGPDERGVYKLETPEGWACWYAANMFDVVESPSTPNDHRVKSISKEA